MRKYSYACCVPLMEAECEQIMNLCEKYESTKSALLRRFLVEGLAEFEEKNNFSLNLSLEYRGEAEAVSSVIFYLSEDTAVKLKDYSNKTKLPVRNIARYFIIPRLERSVQS